MGSWDVLIEPNPQEMLGGIAAAEVDKLVETKGLDAIDKWKAKREAEKHAHQLADQRYQGGNGFDYAQQQGGYAGQYNYQAPSGPPFGGPGCPSYNYGGAPQGGY